MGACGDIFSKVKGKLSHLACPTTKKEAQCLVSFFGFWKQHIPHLGVLLFAVAHLLSDPPKLLVLSRTRGGSAVGSGCCVSCPTTWGDDPVDEGVLEVMVADGVLLGACGRALQVNHSTGLWQLEHAVPSSTDNYFPFEEELLHCY